jgi:UDP-GlcNAc:undecaprenyl-phosphate GlcNAc-1-phosphate transferase
VLETWGLTLALAFMAPWLATDLLIPWVVRLAYRVGKVDTPDARKVHTMPVPRLGGLAIVAGFFLGLALLEWLVPGELFNLEGPIGGVLAGGALMFLVGFIDDLKPLDAKVKLLLQITAASVAYALGVKITFVSNPMSGGLLFLPFWIPPLVTIFYMVGITNTINLIDGLDGLAGGVSLIAALTIAIIAMQTNQPTAGIVAMALAGATIGFLRYNFNPAKIFMGDGGALFLGITLASASIVGLLKLVAAVAFALPLVILGVPILDTSFAILRRLWNRKPIFSPDRGHLHHRLLDAGLDQRRAVMVIYGICLLLGGAALGLARVEGQQVVFALGALCLTYGVLRLWRLRARAAKAGTSGSGPEEFRS